MRLAVLGTSSTGFAFDVRLHRWAVDLHQWSRDVVEVAVAVHSALPLLS